MKTKHFIYVLFLFTSILITGCYKFSLNQEEQYLCGRWKIVVLDSCSEKGSWSSVLRDKGIFYFHSNLTCDVKNIDREPFLFGKSFYWRITGMPDDGNQNLEIYNEQYIFPSTISYNGYEEMSIYITMKNVDLVGYYVVLKRCKL
ncbi:MAG: hypothetical protein PHC83_03885 [Bacteroidales bacterium]|nr:hypothetical protein [Bacteroidales bacterium]MDD3280692.1 hypothetical protein [Bacteroidales bacterium]MDD4209132.1 hypothetical protein [Bacteroidales bacterium]